MTDRAELTASFLDGVREHGAVASELIGNQPDNDMLVAFYRGRFLSRPLFLGYEERVRLQADLENLHTALTSLPERLFDGDLGAFARAVGMNDVQVSAILRSRGAAVTKQIRADMYVDESGFKLLEYNMGSALGGIDVGEMSRALLEHPLMREFAEEHRLGYADFTAEKLHDIVAESGFAPDDDPVVVIADWPSSYVDLAPYIALTVDHWRARGMDVHGCHVGELEVRDGAVWLGELKVDIIHRLFLIEDLLESEEAVALLDPVLDAAAAGQVKIFTPMESEAFASKGALAMLSDEGNRHLLTEEERVSLDRILPWTRMLRPGKVTLENGELVEMLDYVLAHQEDLVLKPTLLHGGQGVLLGWEEQVTPEVWREQVTAGLDGPYLIQRRVDPLTEYFPDEQGELVPWLLVWGIFGAQRGFGGIYARGTTLESRAGVVNTASGAYAGTGLHELGPDETA
ncbi:hypothetical protein P3T35_002060 [Kitasatospora sp. GP30]|uniref:hypothetical protein n=1 Tax=Kitasatospora sp. GP30 TaxID=3035084 RepID=UPI000CAE1962|nr:hypothetical protein [Kitasatospora sp. GP30]MDH6140052.1 hypothetical protein [Kitasatospora sp. GP30]